MNKQLGELTIKKSTDHYGEIIKALEDAGFLIILEAETTTDGYYIVAKSEGKAIQYGTPLVDVLDKIRAEIEQIDVWALPKDERTAEHIKTMVLDIIDRHISQQ